MASSTRICTLAAPLGLADGDRDAALLHLAETGDQWRTLAAHEPDASTAWVGTRAFLLGDEDFAPLREGGLLEAALGE